MRGKVEANGLHRRKSKHYMHSDQKHNPEAMFEVQGRTLLIKGNRTL